MKLISIDKATQDDTPTRLELLVTAEIEGVIEQVPYIYDPSDQYGLAPQIKEALKQTPNLTINPYVAPPKPFTPLPRAAFLFMAKKLGLDDAAVRGLIARMPATTPAEIDAKEIALLVYENQQTFERYNALLKTLVAVSGLTDKQVDAAWRIGENIKW